MIIVNYLVMFTLLRYRCPAVAHILIHSVNLAFGPKSGFKCQVRTCDFWLRLQIEIRLQLGLRVICILTKACNFASWQNLTLITYF